MNQTPSGTNPNNLQQVTNPQTSYLQNLNSQSITSTPRVYNPGYLYTQNAVQFQVYDYNQIQIFQQPTQPLILYNNNQNAYLVGPSQNQNLTNQNNLLYVSPAATGWAKNIQPPIMGDSQLNSQATNVNLAQPQFLCMNTSLAPIMNRNPFLEHFYPSNNQNQMIINIQNDQRNVNQNVSKNIVSGVCTGNLKNKRLTNSKIHVVPSLKKKTIHKNEETLYICPHEGCGVPIKRKDDLKRHMRKHTGIKPFTCIDCEKKFSRKDHLLSHRRTHTDERPFKCAKCPSSFKRSDERNRHMKKHTKRGKGEEQETKDLRGSKT